MSYAKPKAAPLKEVATPEQKRAFRDHNYRSTRDNVALTFLANAIQAGKDPDIERSFTLADAFMIRSKEVPDLDALWGPVED